MKKSYMKVNGASLLISGKEKDCKFGKMALFMKAGGKIIKQMAEVG